MGARSILHHQDRLVNLARPFGAITRLNTGKRGALIQNVVNQQNGSATGFLMRAGHPLQLSALEFFPIARGMHIIDLQGKLQLGQEQTERDNTARHHADHQGVGA